MMLNHILHLLKQHGFIVEESRCSPDLFQWDKIYLPEVQQLVFSVPRHLQADCCLKKDGMPCPPFLRHVAIQYKMSYYFS